MKITRKWLEEFVEIECDTAKLCTDLTGLGLEVEACETAALAFDEKVVVAQIMTCQKHPNADKLKVCEVSIGGEVTLQIVCGAPNAREGLITALAQVGTKLHSSDGVFKIKKSKIRGVESLGMLCSAQELGLQDTIDGIVELEDRYDLGQTLLSALSADDTVIELGVTPNRADCNSVLGVARELACLYQKPLKSFEKKCQFEVETQRRAPEIELARPADCSRYCAVVIDDVDLQVRTPLSMQVRLLACGLRCHDTVVDVTNYVMLELGQPLHAFDNGAIEDKIVVRSSLPNEKLEFLDGKTQVFPSKTLVIADSKKAIACAGIMGGLNSAIGKQSETILLEAAYFHPQAIRQKARQLGYQTDASYRFERGVDPQLCRLAMGRAVALLQTIAKAKSGIVRDKIAPSYKKHCERVAVIVRNSRVQSLLGITIDIDRVRQIFHYLQCAVEQVDADTLRCTAPSYRFDLAIEQDYIEEIARIFGYDNIPLQPLSLPLNFRDPTPELQLEKSLQAMLLGMGFNEVIGYSFISSAVQSELGLQNPIALQSPLSKDQDSMRVSLIPGLLQTVKFNVNRQHKRLRLYEIGQCFQLLRQQLSVKNNLALVLVGENAPEYPLVEHRQNDFYDIKGCVEQLLSHWHTQLEWRECELSYAHPYQKVAIVIDGCEIGHCGVVHPKVLQYFSIVEAVAFAEINLKALPELSKIQLRGIVSYPMVRRDLTIEIASDITYRQVLDIAKSAANATLQSIVPFDIYTGEQVKEGNYSLSIALTFQSEKATLTDKQIEQQVQSIFDALSQQVCAKIR